jgi:hypothetical protein
MMRSWICVLMLWLTAGAAWADDMMTIGFHPNKYGLENVRSVVLRGSFTSWMKSSWPLQQGADGVWRVTRPRTDYDIPGNSGQPEYKFVVNDTQWIGAEMEAPGYQFTGNFVVLFPGDDPASIVWRDQQASVVKDEYASEGQLSNFRELGGRDLAPGMLFRSYHPFIPSRSALKSEADRLKAVQKLIEENGINAVINLADHTADVVGPEVPSYYARLVAEDKVLLQITSYEESYFSPQSATYAYALQRVFDFMATHPGPYLIHCRLGTDRTGVMSAILEATMGVPWQTIAADFDRSNELGIKEYRHPKLLAYAFKQMLGAWPEEVPDLAGAMRAFLVKQGVAAEKIAAVRTQLQRLDAESF